MVMMLNLCSDRVREMFLWWRVCAIHGIFIFIYRQQCCCQVRLCHSLVRLACYSARWYSTLFIAQVYPPVIVNVPLQMIS